MRRTVTTGFGWVACFLAVALLPPAAYAQNRRSPRGGAFRRLDRNGDRKVTRAEANGARWFDRVDRDGDGTITLEELPRHGRGQAGEVNVAVRGATRSDLGYGEHAAQRLDIYAPDGVRDAPVMVYLHGGGWRRGDKGGAGVPKKAEFFTGRGWVLVSVNYRLLPDGKHPRNVQDVARAIVWVHEHIAESGGDPGKLFLMGHSAGAHLVSLVATDERRLGGFGKSLSIIRGVVALDTNTYDLPALMQSRGSQFHKQVFGDDPTVWRDASPITHVAPGKDIPPFLVCYSRGMGARPNPMRPAQANAFAEALKKSGIRSDVVDAADRNHGEINRWFGDPDDERVTGRAVVFLDAILSSTTSPPSKQTGPRFRFAKDYFPGTVDAAGKPLAGTEMMNFAVHNGKLYAGLGNRNLPDDAAVKVGAQVIVKEDESSAWRVDHQFVPTAPRVNAMISARFTTDNAGHDLESPVAVLVAAPSDAEVSPGGVLRWGTAWTRDDATGRWTETRVYSADRRKPACRSLGTYRDPVTRVSHLFAGTSHGSVYRAAYDESVPGRLVWSKTPELEHVGRVVAFAQCNGVLYASCGLRRTREGIRGGLYRRVNGPRRSWECVYRWPWPERRGGADEALLMRGITAVPALDGNGQVLLGSRARPGVIERIDPRVDHAVTVDLDLRTHFAKLWNLPQYKRAALSAYNTMAPWTHPDTGKVVYLIGVAVLHPTLADTPPHNGAWFLIRDAAANYSTHYIHDPAHPVPSGTNLRGTRAIQPSPFDKSAIFVGGGDIGKRTSLNTAWIYKGMLRGEDTP